MNQMYTALALWQLILIMCIQLCTASVLWHYSISAITVNHGSYVYSTLYSIGSKVINYGKCVFGCVQHWLHGS